MSIRNIDTHGDRDYIVYCDGGCCPVVGAWSCIVVGRDGSERECSAMVFGTTNNIMELSGALAGLLLCPEGSRVRVVSDSQYVIKAMGIWIKGWERRGWKKTDGEPVKNLDLIQALHAAALLRSVEYCWVRGHSGHHWNERCDVLCGDLIRLGSRLLVC